MVWAGTLPRCGLTRCGQDTGIVYCISRWRCDELAATLAQNGINAKAYHSGLDPSVKKQVQQEWSDDTVHVIVVSE